MKRLFSLPLLSITILTLLSGFLSNTKNHTENTYYLFSHGIADTHRQAYNYAKTYTVDGQTYTNDRYTIENTFVTFDYPDATTKFWRVNFWKTSLGQDSEIETLKKAYDNLLKKYDVKIRKPNIILFGVSRGASTIINLLSRYHPPHLKAIILESPFDHGKSVANNMLQRFNINSSKRSHEKMGHSMLSLIFKHYKTNGIQPIDVIHNIYNKDIPILIICSKQDILVPWNSSAKLYEMLKSVGYKNAHILILEHGKHAQLLYGESGNIYQNTVQAFYQKYGLQHDTENAFAGKKILAKCQP